MEDEKKHQKYNDLIPNSVFQIIVEMIEKKNPIHGALIEKINMKRHSYKVIQHFDEKGDMTCNFTKVFLEEKSQKYCLC